MELTFQNLCYPTKRGNLIFKPLLFEKANEFKVTFALALSFLTDFIPWELLLLSHHRFPPAYKDSDLSFW